MRAMNLGMDLIDDAGRPIIDPDREKKTPQQGASTSVFAATSPLLAEIGGVYLKDNDISPLDDAPKPITFGTTPIVESTVVPHAIDPVSAARLWDPQRATAQGVTTTSGEEHMRYRTLGRTGIKVSPYASAP